MKQVQATERSEFIQAQKDTLTKMLEEQKVEIDAQKSMGTDGSNAEKLQQLSLAHSAERKAIAKTHSDERNKLADTYAAERKAYSSGQ